MTDERLTRRRILASLGTAGSAGIAGCSFGDSNETPTETNQSPSDENTTENGTGSQTTSQESSSETIHVSTDGSDDNSGTEAEPLSSIQTAVEQVEPGQTIYVHPGEYVEYVEIHNGGEPGAPIELTGPPDAVLKPPKDIDYQALTVGASHVHVTGLTISGIYDADDYENPDSYHSGKLVDLSSLSDDVEYIENLVISPHGIGGAGGALINSIRIKNCEIGGFKVIGPAGTNWIFDDTENHYGEIVYLGTASNNIVKRGEFDDYDNSRNIRVHHIDNSEGHPHSELVDCKTGVENVTIEYCTDAWGAEKDDGIERTQIINMGGYNCTVRWNLLRGSRGYGIEINGGLMRPEYGELSWRWSYATPETEFEENIGTENAVYGNVITEYTQTAVYFQQVHRMRDVDGRVDPENQRHVCGNTIDGPTDGSPDAECDAELPAGEGIGHLGGDSPWRDEPGDLDDVMDEVGRPDFSFESTLHTDSVGVETPLRVETEVRNDGDVRGRTWARLAVDDVEADRKQVTLDPGQSTTAEFESQVIEEFTVPAGSTGEEMAVSLNDERFDSVQVNSAFEVEPTIREETVTQGDPLAVDVMMSHTGDAEATIELVLGDVVRDDWRFDTRVFSVPAGETVEETLSWDTNTPFKYPLELNERKIGAVMVEETT